MNDNLRNETEVTTCLADIFLHLTQSRVSRQHAAATAECMVEGRIQVWEEVSENHKRTEKQQIFGRKRGEGEFEFAQVLSDTLMHETHFNHHTDSDRARTAALATFVHSEDKLGGVIRLSSSHARVEHCERDTRYESAIERHGSEEVREAGLESLNGGSCDGRFDRSLELEGAARIVTDSSLLLPACYDHLRQSFDEGGVGAGAGIEEGRTGIEGGSRDIGELPEVEDHADHADDTRVTASTKRSWMSRSYLLQAAFERLRLSARDRVFGAADCHLHGSIADVQGACFAVDNRRLSLIQNADMRSENGSMDGWVNTLVNRRVNVRTAIEPAVSTAKWQPFRSRRSSSSCAVSLGRDRQYCGEVEQDNQHDQVLSVIDVNHSSPMLRKRERGGGLERNLGMWSEPENREGEMRCSRAAHDDTANSAMLQQEMERPSGLDPSDATVLFWADNHHFATTPLASAHADSIARGDPSSCATLGGKGGDTKICFSTPVGVKSMIASYLRKDCPTEIWSDPLCINKKEEIGDIGGGENVVIVDRAARARAARIKELERARDCAREQNRSKDATSEHHHQSEEEEEQQHVDEKRHRLPAQQPLQSQQQKQREETWRLKAAHRLVANCTNVSHLCNCISFLHLSPPPLSSSV